MNLFTQAIISGLMTGALYTLLGIGLVLVYRTARMLNLAHGETFAITGVVAALLTASGVPLLASFAIAAAGCGRLRHGLASIRTAAAERLAGRHADPDHARRGVRRTRSHDPSCRDRSGFVSSIDQCAAVAVCWRRDAGSGPGACAARLWRLIAVALFLAGTQSGKQLLATAENPYAAELLGVDVEKARLIAYGIAGLLGALAGVLLIPLIAVDFQSGLGDDDARLYRSGYRRHVAGWRARKRPRSRPVRVHGRSLSRRPVSGSGHVLRPDLRRALAEPQNPVRRRKARVTVRNIVVAVAFAFVGVLPYLGILPGWTPPLATVTAFMALSLIGLNLIFGVTGMLALGQAAFVVLPGYAAGIMHAPSECH